MKQAQLPTFDLGDLVQIGGDGNVTPTQPNIFGAVRIGEHIYLWPMFDQRSKPTEKNLHKLEMIDLGYGIKYVTGHIGTGTFETPMSFMTSDSVRVTSNPGVAMGNPLPVGGSKEVRDLFLMKNRYNGGLPIGISNETDGKYRNNVKSTDLQENLVGRT